MKNFITNNDALGAIPPSGVHAYLANRGWKKIEAYGNNGDVYQLDGSPEIVAPASSDFGDYALRVSEIVEILGHVEKRQTSSIIRDLTIATTDLIRVRAPEAEDDGSIMIDAAVQFIGESRNLLLAAACSASRPKSSYPRPGRMREAVEYMDDVRMGQTERGSFVVTLLSPVQPSLAPCSVVNFEGEAQGHLGFDSPEPFPRQVTQKFADALEATKEAVTLCARGDNISAFETRVNRGVSANFCSAIAGLVDAGGGVDMTLSWALTRLPASRFRHNPTVKFTRNDSAFLLAAASIFRNRENLTDERIEGVVTRLARDSDAVKGTVTVQATVDGSLQSVKVDVDEAHYGDITKAHNDRDVVVIEGDIERQGPRWAISKPTSIQVISESSDD